MPPVRLTTSPLPPEKAGIRLDLYAAELSGLTRSRIQRLIELGLLTVNGHDARPNYRTREGDVISLAEPEEPDTLIPEPIPLDVLYQDDFLIVVNKQAGLVVHPAAGNRTGTLMNAIAHRAPHLASPGGPLRPGVVHRLDKDTSGVMVVALEDRAYYDLVEQFRVRSIKRRYLALLYGRLAKGEGVISAPIGRSAADRKKMSTKTRRGKEAVTRWKVLESLPGASLVEAILGTGRTHQIRVHFASLGHPVLGDDTYGKITAIQAGGRKVGIPRQMLHAESLGFRHPHTGAALEFRVDPPDDMKEIIDLLRSPVTTPR